MALYSSYSIVWEVFLNLAKIYAIINHHTNHQRCADIDTHGRNPIAILRIMVLVISLVLILLLILSGRDIINATIAQSNQKIAQDAHALKL